MVRYGERFRGQSSKSCCSVQAPVSLTILGTLGDISHLQYLESNEGYKWLPFSSSSFFFLLNFIPVVFFSEGIIQNKMNSVTCGEIY